MEAALATDFSDAFHAALYEYVGDGPYPFMDLSYEYDFLDDFTCKTSRLRTVSVGFTSNKGLLQAIKRMVDTLLQVEICAERIFYQIEEPREDGVIFVKMWGMQELYQGPGNLSAEVLHTLGLESIELQTVT